MIRVYLGPKSRIFLREGPFALIDDEDLARVCHYTWSAARATPGRLYAHAYDPATRAFIKLHRLIMETPPHLVAHHKDGDTLNCQKSNLRNVTSVEHHLLDAQRLRARPARVRPCFYPLPPPHGAADPVE